MVVMVVSLSMATLCNAHGFCVCSFEVSVVYRYVVNSREVGDAMSSIANLCMYLLVNQTRNDMK